MTHPDIETLRVLYQDFSLLEKYAGHSPGAGQGRRPRAREGVARRDRRNPAHGRRDGEIITALSQRPPSTTRPSSTTPAPAPST